MNTTETPADEEVQAQVINISMKDSINEAERIQRALMVDWSSLCMPWMVGIKHLIQESKRIVMAWASADEETPEQQLSVQGIHAPL